MQLKNAKWTITDASNDCIGTRYITASDGVSGTVEYVTTYYTWAPPSMRRLMETLPTAGMGFADIDRIVVTYCMSEETAHVVGLVQCANCGEWNDEDDSFNAPSGKWYCDEECLEQAGYAVCRQCGEIVETYDAIHAGDMYFCSTSCAHDAELERCADCGEWEYRNDMIYVAGDDNYVCEYCYDNHYSACYRCGDVYHNDDIRYDESIDEYVCPECWRGGSEHIYSYHGWDGGYNPIGEGLHMGIELETDGGDNPAIAQTLHDEYPNYYHCETDSSLHNGVEVISQPMTIGDLVDTLPIVADIARANGATSHDAGTCGLHIHLERKWYTDRMGTFGDYLAESRLRIFFASHQNELVNFSRRRENQLTHWCSMDSMVDCTADEYVSLPGDGELKELDKARKSKDRFSRRYLPVNGTNGKTIEIRLWRGTLNPDTIRATLALTYATAHYVATHPDRDCLKISWADFINYTCKLDGIPEEAVTSLRSYLETRGL